MCSLSKEQSLLSRDINQSAFFSELCPLFDLDFFFILYQAPHSRPLAPACSALVLHLEAFESNAISDLRNHISNLQSLGRKTRKNAVEIDWSLRTLFRRLVKWRFTERNSPFT